MSLAGLHYLIDFSPHLYAGAGGYGAVGGSHGGFFAGGLEAGIRQVLVQDLFAEAGIFVGAGGGGAAPQGGGLMLRPHAGLWYDLRSVRTGVQYAQIYFPNGKISCGQLALSLDIPFETLLVHYGYQGDLPMILDRASRITGKPVGFSRDYAGPFYQVYVPSAHVTNTDGETKTGTFGTIGIEFGRYYDRQSYGFIAAAGAMEGHSSGFAELFLGTGYQWRVYSFEDGGRGSLFIDWRIAGGAAGGGRVDTGGGLVLKTSMGLRALFHSEFTAGVSGGYVRAPAGSFSAAAMTFDLTYLADFASFDRRAAAATPADSLYLSSWQVGLAQQTYLTHDPRVRKSPDNTPVSLMGFRLHRELSRSLFVTGQALAAYDGSAGGYAVGLLGLRLLSSPVLTQQIRLFLEASAGGAGGGGIPVGGGGVVQGMAGVMLDIGRSFSLEASYGKIRAIQGELDSSLFEVGMAYRFSTLCRKIVWAGAGR
jgi:hypothetical protein